jgi:hypothetical protein
MPLEPGPHRCDEPRISGRRRASSPDAELLVLDTVPGGTVYQKQQRKTREKVASLDLEIHDGVSRQRDLHGCTHSEIN